MRSEMFNPDRYLRFGTLRGRDMQGNMDYYMFQKRFEPETLDYDADNYMWNYYRSELRNQFGDNNYCLESENIPYNRFSKENLLFRHTGSTTGATPLIYDGGWTFHDMIKDHRGWTNEPPYEEMRRINENRFWNMPFADSGKKQLGDIMDPADLIAATEWWYDYLRGTRYNMFGTSEENLIKGGPPGAINKHTIGEKIAHQMARTGEGTMFNKSSTNLSNDMTILGHRSVPGHKFEVPRYGILYGMGPLSDHKTAMKLTRYENVFGNSKLMSTVSRKMRKLSYQRSMLLDYLSDTIVPDSKQSHVRKSLELTANMLSLMGFTINDLRDTSKVVQGKGMKKLDMPPDIRKFVETLHKMPDSKKTEISAGILSHLTNALGDVRKSAYNIQNTQAVRELKENMISGAPLHDLKKRANDVIVQLKDHGLENQISKSVVNKIEGGFLKNVSILLKDDAKQVPNYRMMDLSEHKKPNSNVELTENVYKMIPKRMRHLAEDPRLRSEVNVAQDPERITLSRSIVADNEHRPFADTEMTQKIKEYDW